MTDPVYKVVELVETFEVRQVRGSIVDGKVGRYQVTLKAGFALEGSSDAG